MTVTIRPALEPELHQVGELVAAAYLDDGLLAADAPYLAQIRDAVGRSQDSVVLVAIDETVQVMLGTATWCPVSSSHREVAGIGEGEFRMLGVATNGRGRGVGEMLVQECIFRAQREDLDAVVISTSPQMQAARRIYERLGFERVPDRDWTPVPNFPLWAYRLDLQRS